VRVRRCRHPCAQRSACADTQCCIVFGLRPLAAQCGA
jgi:hypothetical protein